LKSLGGSALIGQLEDMAQFGGHKAQLCFFEGESHLRLLQAELANRWVRLEPLALRHREPLRAACAADPAIWTELYPYSMAGEHFDAEWERRMADTGAEGGSLPFAVVSSGEVVGITRYLDIDSANATAEIGGTYYRPEVRGGPVNPAAKRLLLERAFEAGARRTAFRVDALNLRSQAAVLKLGAVKEALLRQDRVTWTGRIRDTVVFSILADEWPAVRDRLDARLAAFG
jgi:RimJ/RimL family protein N-acetyltransferase